MQPQRFAEALSQERWHRIPDLSPLLVDVADQLEIVGERLKTLNFLDAENPVAPMEGAHIVGPPSLNGPSGQSRAEL